MNEEDTLKLDGSISFVKNTSKVHSIREECSAL